MSLKLTAYGRTPTAASPATAPADAVLLEQAEP